MKRLIRQTANNKQRLIKKALMDIKMLEGTIEQLGDKGREILKGIEDFKFELEQAARIVANDPTLSQKIVQKRTILDQAAGQVYAIVFDLENIDITQAYQEQQLMMNNPMPPQTDTHPVEEPVDTGAPVAPGVGGDEEIIDENDNSGEEDLSSTDDIEETTEVDEDVNDEDNSEKQ
jgi:hypothetical protein